MTETQWFACTNSGPMLKSLRGKVSERKLRLFACACCRRILDLISGPQYKELIEIAEQYAEGSSSLQDLMAQYRAVCRLLKYPTDYWFDPRGVSAHTTGPQWHAEHATLLAAFAFVERAAENALIATTTQNSRQAEEQNQVALVREIFANPFRTVSIEPGLRTNAVTSLARTIADDRRFEDIPLLGDALEEAGCTNPDILSHCRGPGPHVLGCWVVDLLLGKS
jgi:hypothetical protein